MMPKMEKLASPSTERFLQSLAARVKQKEVDSGRYNVQSSFLNLHSRFKEDTSLYIHAWRSRRRIQQKNCCKCR